MAQEELQIIPFEPNGNYEDYEKVKLSVIEKIEILKAQKSHVQTTYKRDVEPLLKIYTIAKRNAKGDKEIKKYIDNHLEELRNNGFSEEEHANVIKKYDENIAALEKMLNDYFTEEIRDGYAYPNPEALIYCKIQAIITLK